CTNRRTGLGQIHDAVEQSRLDLRRAPGKLDRRLHALLLKVALRRLHKLRFDDFAVKVLGLADVRLLRHRQHPARGIGAGLAVLQLADFDHVVLVAVLDDPVPPGQAAIDDVVTHVAADLLRAKEYRGDLRIVERREDAALGDAHAKSRLGEQLDGGVLKASRRKPQAQRGGGKLVGHALTFFRPLPSVTAARSATKNGYISSALRWCSTNFCASSAVVPASRTSSSSRY